MQQQNGAHTKPRCRILIIGGGLAGLATAIAVMLAGHEAIIFERMPELKEVRRNYIIYDGIQLMPCCNRSARASNVRQTQRFSSNAGAF